jgi:hypothetical protein
MAVEHDCVEDVGEAHDLRAESAVLQRQTWTALHNPPQNPLAAEKSNRQAIAK